MAFRFDDWIRGEGLVAIFADATARATMLLLVSCVLAGTVRRSSAALRHRIWSLTLCGLIALPLASWMVPGWQLPVFSIAEHSIMTRQRMPRTSVTRSLTRRKVRYRNVRPNDSLSGAGLRRQKAADRIGDPSCRSRRDRPGPRRHSETTIPELKAPHDGRWPGDFSRSGAWDFSRPRCRRSIGVLINEWNRRRSRPVPGDEWRILLDTLRRGLSIGRHVEFRQGRISPIPLTWGVVRPIILLPDDAQGWTEPKRRAVLLHELAHVHRLDAGFQLAGRVAAALYWFHPLAWYALHRLRLEAEQACDDCVILAGERPTDYAQQLLDLAKSVRIRRFSMALAMARSNTLERRVKAMFDETRSHSADESPGRMATRRGCGRSWFSRSQALILCPWPPDRTNPLERPEPRPESSRRPRPREQAGSRGE